MGRDNRLVRRGRDVFRREEQNTIEVGRCGGCGGPVEASGSCGSCSGSCGSKGGRSAAYDPVALAAAKILDLIRRGGTMPTSMASTGVPIPPGGGAGYGDLVANPPMVPPGGDGDPGDYGGDWADDFDCNPGCYPTGFTTIKYRNVLRNECRGRRRPYMDRCFDFNHMQTLYSAQVTVPAGATVVIPISPNAGTFAAFYYSIVARDPITGLPVEDWDSFFPRVTGCPTPCDVDGPIMSQFTQRVPEACCCGRPVQMWLDRRSEAVPAVVTVVNNSANPIQFQVELLGYCCSTRIC